jgi:predicted secreted hydrolase
MGREAELSVARIITFLSVVGCLTGCAADDQTDCPEVNPVFSLPADEAPHRTDMEWWYYTGHLWNASGKRYGFEYSFFQIVHEAVVTYMGHLAISDAENLIHHYDQLVGTAAEIFPRFDLVLFDWTMSGNGNVDRLRASMDGFAIDLSCHPLKPPAIHNQRGVIAMGGGMESYYYSKTRMDVTGTLTVGETEEAVTGMAWTDHQWGDFDIFASDGWDWFSIQLNDMTEIMIFLLHFKEGDTELTGGTFMDQDGCQHAIDVFELKSLTSWESPETGAVYPLGWELKVADQDLDLSITPVFESQELDTRETTLNVYWEGETRIEGTRRGNPVEGFGYTELAGYGTWGPD